MGLADAAQSLVQPAAARQVGLGKEWNPLERPARGPVDWSAAPM
jgi:hypothetical protein